MKILNYKSLGSIIWRVLKNPLCSELTYEECAEYALEFIKLLGAPVAYIDNIDKIELTNYKAELPCNILYINGIRYFNSNGDNNVYGAIAMRESTDIYHHDPLNFSNNGYVNNYSEIQFPIAYNSNEYTYSIQKGIIFTSKRDGIIEIAYKGIAVDEDGYPMIPDNEKVSLGMEYYIMSRYLEPLYLIGKITDKAFEYIQQKRYFYMPSAVNSLQMPSVDGMESLMNSLNRLIIPTNSHKNFFKNSGQKEIIKRYR